MKIRIEIDGDELDVAELNYKFRAAVHTTKVLMVYVGAFVLIAVMLSLGIHSTMRL